MQNLDSSVVSKEFMNALTKHLEKSEILNSQAIGNLGYGIQNLDSSVVSKAM